MEKMRMESPDITAQNVEKIAALFPNCITETADAKGKLRKAIDFDKLRHMLGDTVSNGEETYEFKWVGKKRALDEARKTIRKTLRPCPEESNDWDNTQNLYIEGDNLDVLKLLQESYLGKVKIIYIDPPYNTGHDSFVYPDNHTMDKAEYEDAIGLYDEEGNRLYKENNAANPRFHSDWCSMMYSRLLLSRNLLSEDGIIFISIDDNEQDNLKKICDEVFGSANFMANIIWEKADSPRMDAKSFSTKHDFIVVYAKQNTDNIIKKDKLNDIPKHYDKVDASGKRYYLKPLRYMGNADAREDRPNLYYAITAPDGQFIYPIRSDGSDGRWRWSKEKLNKNLDRLEFVNGRTGWTVYTKIYADMESEIPIETIWYNKDVGSNRTAMAQLKKIFEGEKPFSTPKPIELIERILQITSINDAIILDFFSGSSTTAHAVMSYNAKNQSNSKFIMVQVEENCENTAKEYKNLCEIGKERIRRAGAKIKKDAGLLSDKLDTGFRVLKVADSNMENVYYEPGKLERNLLPGLESNIKKDRTALDLLFGCLLEWGVPLDKDYHSEVIDGFTVHFYQGSNYVACFDSNVSETLIEEIAKHDPVHILFRDSCFASAPAKMNMFEICKRLMPAKAADIRRIVTVL